jgi:predicted small lipoprotein YifL
MKMQMLALVFALAACGKETQKGPPLDPPVGSGSATPTDTNVAAGSGSAGSAAGSGSAAAVDVPTEMDYEELAQEEITDKTVEARLKNLESELSPQ